MGSLYSPLLQPRAFRLLRLLPAPPGQPIQCELKPTTLDDARDGYEAVSYRWISGEQDPTITCDGLPLSIQDNAFALLSALRYQDRPRLLWIDAICINQNDPNEKGSQVALMADIYHEAKRVTIWLGEADESSRKAVAYASALEFEKFKMEINQWINAKGMVVQEAQAMAEKSFFFDDFDPQQLDESQQAGFKELTDHLGKFLMRSYFGRVWMQQEVRLAKDIEVYCGPDTFDWQVVWVLAWLMLPRNPGVYPQFANDLYTNLMGHLGAIIYMERHRFRDSASAHHLPNSLLLFDQLDTYRNLGATDPRDKVYALLNLVSDGYNWVEKVDYEIPWQILYLRIAKDALASGNMNILENAGRARQEPGSTAPSWMPDFRTERPTDFMLQKHPQWRADKTAEGLVVRDKARAASNPFCAVHPLTKRQRRRVEIPKSFDKEPPVRGPLYHSYVALYQSYVTFKCYMMDEIIYIGREWDRLQQSLSVDRSTAAAASKDLEFLEELGEMVYLSGETASAAFKLTCMLGSDGSDGLREGTRDVQTALREARDVERNWEEWMDWLRREECGDDSNTEEAAIPRLFGPVASAQYPFHYQFAITKNGFFCLVPKIAEVGDQIALISGYGMPVVVRNYTPGPERNGEERPARDKNGKNGGKAGQQEFHEFVGDAYVHGAMEGEVHNIMGVFPLRHNPTPAQREKIEVILRDEEYDAWNMLDLSSNYERIIWTIGTRELYVV